MGRTNNIYQKQFNVFLTFIDETLSLLAKFSCNDWLIFGVMPHLLSYSEDKSMSISMSNRDISMSIFMRYLTVYP